MTFFLCGDLFFFYQFLISLASSLQPPPLPGSRNIKAAILNKHFLKDGLVEGEDTQYNRGYLNDNC